MLHKLSQRECLTVQDNLRRQDISILLPDGLQMRVPVAGAVLKIPPHEWANYVHDGQLILRAAQKIIRALIVLNRKQFMQGCSEPELWFTWQHGPQPLALVRFDGILGSDWKSFRFIELNTTIPAMTAYADMTQSCYGSEFSFIGHTENLRRSLMSFYNLHGGLKDTPSILIVSRESDAQTAELKYLQQMWEKSGHRTAWVSEKEISIVNEKVSAGGETFDLVYRHIFVNRLSEGSAFLNACLDWQKFHIANPPAAAMEVKSLFAFLSAIADDSSLQKKFHVADDEVRAIRKRIPWTRIWTEGTELFEAEVDSETRKKIYDAPAGYIVKKNRSFGGRSTFFGKDGDQPLRDAAHPSDQSIWIVQKSLLQEKISLQRVGFDAIEEESDFYFDLGVFANSDVPLRIAGPIGRFSKNPVVNLGLGGGLLPCTVS